MECILLYSSSKLVSAARRFDPEMPTMKPLPARELSLDGCQKLTKFVNVYGRAVRQRSVRQETTMAKAGTLPYACYETNLPVQRVMLRRDA